jgi:hypothetical protein
MIFCTSYFDKLGRHSFKRYNKWLEHHLKKLDQFGASNIFLIDDGSSEIGISTSHDVMRAESLLDELSAQVNCVTFIENLGRESVLCYPGWWRSFTYSLAVAEHFGMQRIIHIESDFFVLSDRLIQFIKEKNNGWTSLYSRHYDFPETGIQIIAADAFPLLRTVLENVRREEFRCEREAELLLPFTEIERGFKGDRFGEVGVLEKWLLDNPIGSKIDYIGQIPSNSEVVEFKAFFNF